MQTIVEIYDNLLQSCKDKPSDIFKTNANEIQNSIVTFNTEDTRECNMYAIRKRPRIEYFAELNPQSVIKRCNKQPAHSYN